MDGYMRTGSTNLCTLRAVGAGPEQPLELPLLLDDEDTDGLYRHSKSSYLHMADGPDDDELRRLEEEMDNTPFSLFADADDPDELLASAEAAERDRQQRYQQYVAEFTNELREERYLTTN